MTTTDDSRRPPGRHDFKPITEERIRRALRDCAYVIAEFGRVEYVPLMERLEHELKAFREGTDPVSRARAILKREEDADALNVRDRDRKT